MLKTRIGESVRAAITNTRAHHLIAGASARYIVRGLYWLRDEYNLRNTLPEPFDWADHLGNVYPSMRYCVYAGIGFAALDEMTDAIRSESSPLSKFNPNAVKRMGVFMVGVAANAISESGAYDAVFNTQTSHDPIDAAYGIIAGACVAAFVYPSSADSQESRMTL